MHLHLIEETVKRLREDSALRQRVALDPDTALLGTRLTHDERRALGALSRQSDAVGLLSQRVQW